MEPNCFKASLFGDEVWFIMDESFKQFTPPSAIVYTLAEAEVLAEKPDWHKRMAHEAKKQGGARLL